MLNLARSLETFDFRSTAKLDIPVQPDDVDNETRLMVEALQEFSDRLDQFIERERTFTRDAGHELRTPMAVMRGSLEILAQRPNLTTEDQQVVTRMQNTMRDMQTLLETLLMLAREEDVLAVDAVNMNHVISEEIELHAELAEQRNNIVIFEEHADHHCHAKEKVLGIVVGNLLRNALTYTQNGRITIRLTDTVLSVADTGIGMSERDLDNVFSAFYRGEAAKQISQGQGLGLALVRRLVRQLDWRVEVASTLGTGTTFTVFYKA
jgi:signal transduction histidine kinase